MKNCSGKKRHAAACKAFAATLAVIAASGAGAQTHIDYYTPPAARTQVTGSDHCNLDFLGCVDHRQVDFDGQILGELGDVFPRWAISSLFGSSAYAEASKNRFAAEADSNAGADCYAGCAAARGAAFLSFVAHDPQGRPEIKLHLKAKGAVTVGGKGGGGQVSVKVCVPDGPAETFYNALGQFDATFVPCVDAAPPYDASASVYMAGDTGRPVATTIKTIAVFGVPTTVTGTGASVALLIDEDVPVIPGLPYMITVTAGAGASLDGAALSTVDPVLEPASVNPDVTIEFPNLADDPGPQPLMGDLTPEALQALGIDPQTFVDLGFFDPASPPPPPPPSGDATPPATSASATPGANAQGWNNTPVTVALNATDNAGGSGVQEVHYALAGAATGSQAVSGDGANVTISAEGTTTLTYFAVDNAGNQEAAHTLTVRIDRTPPTVTGLPSNCTLWPADDRLVQVASVAASDALSGLMGPLVVTATSNEPESGGRHRGSVGTGRRDSAPDIAISGGTVQLRAARARNGTGRVYTITATASDLADNTATETATCVVPHDMRGQHHRGR
jgi:hypothetical protein